MYIYWYRRKQETNVFIGHLIRIFMLKEVKD